MSVFIPLDRLDALARKFCIGPYAKVQEQKLASAESTEFDIIEQSDSFVLKGIPYLGGHQDIAWGKELLNNGQTLTQDSWTDFLQKSEWQLPDALTYHATLAALYQHKDGFQSQLVERVRSVFSKYFRKNLLMTGTRVVYEPQGNDVVKHSHDEVPAVIVGANGRVNAESGFEDSIEVLLGTRDLTEVEDVYLWLSERKPYLRRLNNRSNQRIERVVVLGVEDDRFNIYCYDYFDYSWPALGVVYMGAKKFHEE